MSHFHPKIAIAGFVLALGTVLVSGHAQGASVLVAHVGNATDNCQSALPVFDVQIRKRPLAVQNEGSSNAFVTCAYSDIGLIQSATITLGSTSPGPRMVTCTGVAGNVTDEVFYSVKSVLLPGGDSHTALTWTGGDFGGGTNLPANPFGVSCNLLPEMGVQVSNILFFQQVGAI